MKIHEIDLKEYITHKDTVFTPAGLSVIRGLNGHGKSLIFSAVHDVIFGAKGSAGSVALKLSCGDRYIRTRLRKSGNGGLDIIEGKVRKNYSATEGRKVLAEITGLSPELYFSTHHLTPYRLNVLVHGTGASRRAFLESALQLSHYDILAKELKKALAEARRDEAALFEVAN